MKFNVMRKVWPIEAVDCFVLCYRTASPSTYPQENHIPKAVSAQKTMYVCLAKQFGRIQ